MFTKLSTGPIHVYDAQQLHLEASYPAVYITPTSRAIVGPRPKDPCLLWLLSFIAQFIILKFFVSRETECVCNLCPGGRAMR